MLLVFVGVRGAGKTTLLQRLAGERVLEVLQPSTTRPPRQSGDAEYDFVPTWDNKLYAWSIQLGSHYYGMRHTEVARASPGIFATVFEPLSIEILEAFRTSDCAAQLTTVGLDTVDNVEEQAARVAGDPRRIMTLADFERARAVVRKCDTVLSGEADAIYDAALALVRIASSRGGLLIEKDIRCLIGGGALIRGGNPEHIRPASYDLSIGDQIWCLGKLTRLDAGSPQFSIPPYSYAIVSARETAALPPFVAGRFDLKVSLFFGGAILSNGPQVDPGYKGALFCMIFNGTGRPKTIVRNLHFATIEFSTTTHLTKAYGQQYQLEERLEKFMSEDALGGVGGNIMELFAEQVRGLQTQLDRLNGWFWGVVAVLVGVLALAAGITLTMLWDRVKQAEEIVSKMREGQQGLTQAREDAQRAIQEGLERALRELQQQTTPSRPPTGRR